MLHVELVLYGNHVCQNLMLKYAEEQMDFGR